MEKDGLIVVDLSDESDTQEVTRKPKAEVIDLLISSSPVNSSLRERSSQRFEASLELSSDDDDDKLLHRQQNASRSIVVDPESPIVIASKRVVKNSPLRPRKNLKTSSLNMLHFSSSDDEDYTKEIVSCSLPTEHPSSTAGSTLGSAVDLPSGKTALASRDCKPVESVSSKPYPSSDPLISDDTFGDDTLDDLLKEIRPLSQPGSRIEVSRVESPASSVNRNSYSTITAATRIASNIESNITTTKARITAATVAGSSQSIQNGNGKEAAPKKARTRTVNSVALSAKDERQRMVEINKRMKSNDLTNELVVYTTSTMLAHTSGLALRDRLNRTEFKELDPVDHRTIWRSYFTGVFLFKRLKDCEYSKQEDLLVPLPTTELEDVPFVYLLIEANEMLRVIVEENLESDLQAISAATGKKVVLIIEGYNQMLNKLANTANRDYSSKVRELMSREGGVVSELENPTTKKRKTTAKSKVSKLYLQVSKDDLEAFVSRLEIHLKVRTVLTTSAADSVEWLESLIKAMSTIPYKQVARSQGEFANVGVIRSGKNQQQTLQFMLEQIRLVTPMVSKAIVESLPSLHDLYRDCQSGARELRKVSTGKRSIGESLSSTIRKVFTSENANDKL